MSLKLPRLLGQSLSPQTIQRYWDQAMTALEAAFNGNASLESDVSELQSGVALRDADNEFSGSNVFDLPPVSVDGYYVGNDQVVGPQETGWMAGTGTPNKGAFAAYAGQVVGGAYNQAQVQAIDDAAKAASQRTLAIEAALRAHGLIN